MKKLFSLFLVSLLLPLSGCFFIRPKGKKIETQDMTMPVFSFVQKEAGQDKEMYRLGEYPYLVVDKEELVPYFSIETYASLISPHFIEGVTQDIYDYGSTVTWSIYKDNELYFLSKINISKKTITVNGSISGLLKSDTDYTESSLNLGMRVNSSVAVEGDGNNTYYYYHKEFPYQVIVKDNKTHLPLSLLENAFANETSLYHYFSYRSLYQYTDHDELNNFEFKDGNTSMTAFEEANAYINSELNRVMPDYVIKDRKNALLFIFENLYGLKSTYEISSMVDYFKKYSFFNDLDSSDNAKRNAAYASIFALLDDGHTGVIDDFNTPWSTGRYSTYGPKLTNMVSVRNELRTKRANFYSTCSKNVGDIVYFNDDKAAFISFDGFTFMNDIYDGNHQIKPELYENDSFFKLVKDFNSIKTHGGVKDIVLDLSINGGGVIGVMFKILALLSHNNSVNTYFKVDLYDDVYKYNISIDSNLDGVYNQDDVFGDDFNIYILTSCYSFSCGNALPFYAQQNGFATIIGQNSGGGECSVTYANLPSGEQFCHSSTMHIGNLDNNKNWIGSETTAKATKTIDYSDYYNLDIIENYF